MTAPVRVALVDHGAGNLLSIGNALSALGADVTTARDAPALRGARLLVIPGVGAPGPAMRRLRRSGLDAAMERARDGGAWCLGVCLGMQLMFESSEEDGSAGLGWMPGIVSVLPGAPRLPHVGWNRLEPVRPHPALAGLPPLPVMYFVHSFAPVPVDGEAILAVTEHGRRFVSAVAQGRLVGLQFHPEKSGPHGLRMLANVLRLAADS